MKQFLSYCSIHFFNRQTGVAAAEAKIVADYLVSENISNRTAKWLAQGIMFSPDNRFANAQAMKAALSSVEGYPVKSVEVLVQK